MAKSEKNSDFQSKPNPPADDFKKTDETNPPVKPRAEIAKAQKQQNQDNTPNLKFTPTAQSKDDLTEEQKNARNKWNNDIKPILRGLTSSQLRAKLTEVASLDLPEKELKAALSAIDSAINQAETNQSSGKQWTSDEIKDSLDMAEKNKAELAKQAKEVDKLWDTANSEEHQKKQEEFDLKDEERNKKLKPFFTKQHLTEEDLKEAKKYRLTDEEIEERKKHWNSTSAAYHGLKDLTSNIAKESNRLGEEIKQLNELEHKEDHHLEHIKALSKHKEHHDNNLKEYNKTLSEEAKKYNKKDVLIADFVKGLENSKLYMNEKFAHHITQHFEIFGKDHEKDLASNPNSKEASNYKIIKEALKNYNDKVAAGKEAEGVRKQSNEAPSSNTKTQQPTVNSTENKVNKQADNLVNGVRSNDLNSSNTQLKPTTKNNSIYAARRQKQSQER